MEPEFALRMEHLRVHNPFAHFVASMEPEFALRMEPWREQANSQGVMLQWSRSLHSGWNQEEP